MNVNRVILVSVVEAIADPSNIKSCLDWWRISILYKNKISVLVFKNFSTCRAWKGHKEYFAVPWNDNLNDSITSGLHLYLQHSKIYSN